MGKKLDALLGRGSKTKKFKATVNLTISRLAAIRRQHQARCSVARSDVMQILGLGQHERALIRVEQVVKEQNLVDVFTMLEIYCSLLIQNAMLSQDQECPEELKEATSSMINASTRCEGIPELQELRAFFTLRFGKEFESRSIQQSNNCNVNPEMIQKLSTSTPCLEIKLEVLDGIARENNMIVQIGVAYSVHSEVRSNNKEDLPEENRSKRLEDAEPGFGEPIVNEDGVRDRFSHLTKMQRIYKDGAWMEQSASLSCGAHAEDTAKAAAELSWPASHDSIDMQTHGLKPSTVADSAETTEDEDSRVKELNAREAVHPLQSNYSESAYDKMHTENKLDMFKQHEEESSIERRLSTSIMGTVDVPWNDESLKEERKRPQGKVIFDDSDYDIVIGGRLFLFKTLTAYSNCSPALHTTEILSS